MNQEKSSIIIILKN